MTRARWKLGSVSGDACHKVEDGKTLTDAKINVWYDTKHASYLKGWVRHTEAFDTNGNSVWTPYVDANGAVIYMTTAQMLADPITANTRYEAK